jgi:GST-like protein
MIDLYHANTPNGQKLTMCLEELRLPYRLITVSLSRGEQYAPEFLKISPNNKIPALVDHAPAGGGEPIALFESGAMLVYLAEKSGRLMPNGLRERMEVLKWLFWQVGGLGPMAGQNGHFTVHASERLPYAIERYVRETARLYRVLDARLDGREHIAGDFSIADIACYPWIVPHEAHGQRLADFPHLQAWFARVAARPATQRAYAGRADAYAKNAAPLSQEARRVLFGGAQPASVATC